MRQYPVLFFLILLSGCVVLAPQGSSVRIVKDMEAVRGCKLIGPVESSSNWGGFAATGVAFDNAMNEIRNKTAQAGGNIALINVFSNTMGGSRIMEDAWACE